MAISRESVIHRFRFFLDREPESEQTVDTRLGMHDETEFAEVPLRSAEFSYGDWRRHLLALRAPHERAITAQALRPVAGARTETATVAHLKVDAGPIVLTAFIAPFRNERQTARALLEPGEL